MKKVLITAKIFDIAKNILSRKYKVDIWDKKKGSLKEAVQKYDAILSTIEEKFNEKIIFSSKKLKVISNCAVGLDNIDLIACEKKSIKVYNLPYIVTNSTADLTMGILLSFARHIIEANKFVKQNKWKSFDANRFLGFELYKKTLGIIGFGRIGQAVAKRAIGFGIKVIFFSRSKKILKTGFKRCKSVSFEKLLETSDFISLNTSLNKSSENLIDKKAFSLMKKRPILINAARGKVINTKDLIYALKKGILTGAALDVTDPEPMYNHDLLSCKNCLIVPHIGTATYECRYNMAKKAAENILNFFADKKR